LGLKAFCRLPSAAAGSKIGSRVARLQSMHQTLSSKRGRDHGQSLSSTCQVALWWLHCQFCHSCTPLVCWQHNVRCNVTS
jgi:hypothetical protein